MGRGLQFIEARLLPRGWLDLLRQIVLFVGALLMYDLVRGLVASDNPYKPFGDAMRIIDSSARCTCSSSPVSRRGRSTSTG